MRKLERITLDPTVMGGKPCIRGMRVTVGTIVGLIASGHSREGIAQLYPYLEDADISEALSYAAWRAHLLHLPAAATRMPRLLAPHAQLQPLELPHPRMP